MKTALGIDIGGTKISITAGTNTGRLLSCVELKTRSGREAKASASELVHACRYVVASLSPSARAGLAGVGVCLPGAVDTARGVVPKSPNLPGWQGLPLGAILKKNLRLPVRLVNDANAAAIGEMLFGAAKGFKDFVYVTVSTGVGSGIVINGQLLEGAGFVAGEIGHMTLVPDGDSCKCGKHGCLEAYTSGTAIETYIKKQIRATNYKKLERFRVDGRLAARELSQAALRGDKLARAAFERSGRYLGVGLANMMNTLNPSLIVLGGGVIKSAPPVFWQALQRSIKKEAWPEALHNFQLKRTGLGTKAGNLGALAVAFDSFKKR